MSEPWIFLVYHGMLWCEKEENFVLQKAGAAGGAVHSAPNNAPPGDREHFVRHVRSFIDSEDRPVAIVHADPLSPDTSSFSAQVRLREWAQEEGLPFIHLTREELHAGAHPDTKRCPSMD